MYCIKCKNLDNFIFHFDPLATNQKGLFVYLRETTHISNTNNSRILDFETQADQLLELIESRLQSGHRDAALQYLIFKFKSLYEQGVASGRLYEKEGVFPY